MKSHRQHQYFRLFVTLIAISCSAFIGRAAGRQQPQEERRPTVELKAVALKGVDVSNQTAETVFSIAIQNPGPKFKLKDLAYKLRLNEYPIAEGKVETEIEIAAAGETVVELPFTVDLTQIPGVAWRTLTDSLMLHYELETVFTVPLFASLQHTQKSSFKGDFPVGDAMMALPGKFKEKIFGKP
jgi:LEA14-like dessication related protein